MAGIFGIVNNYNNFREPDKILQGDLKDSRIVKLYEKRKKEDLIRIGLCGTVTLIGVGIVYKSKDSFTPYNPDPINGNMHPGG